MKKDELFISLLDSLQNQLLEIQSQILESNKELKKLDDEVIDLLHILEMMDLTEKNFKETSLKLKDISLKRREHKNIKMIQGKLVEELKSVIQLNKDLDKMLPKIKEDMQEDNRHYNIRSENTLDFLKTLLDTELDKDYIKKDFNEHSFGGILTNQINSAGYKTLAEKEQEKKTKKEPLSKRELENKLKKLSSKNKN